MNLTPNLTSIFATAASMAAVFYLARSIGLLLKRDREFREAMAELWKEQ